MEIFLFVKLIQGKVKTKETVEVTRHDWFGTSEEQMKEFLSVRELEDLQKTKIFERLDFKE